MMPKYLQIATDLRRRITEQKLRPGDALPTRKALMEQYGVAGVTVKQSLDYLRNQGLVWSRRGSGTYVADRLESLEESARQLMGLACIYGPGVGGPWLFDQLLSAGKLGQVIQSHIRAAYFGHDEVERLLAWAEPMAGVLLWKYVTPDLVRRLQKASKTVMVLGAMVEGECPPGAGQFDVDIHTLIFASLDFLHLLGHRRIVLINRRGSLYRSNISRAFNEYAQIHGTPDEMREYLVESEEEEARAPQTILSAEPRPTAVVVDDGERCNRMVYHLQRAGLRVPDDISLLGITTTEVVQTWMPRLTYAGHSFCEVLSQAMSGLAEMLQTGCIIRHTMSGRVYRGETCVRIAEAAEG